MLHTIRNAVVSIFSFIVVFSGANAYADLPDLTELVEKNTPTVVNITVRKVEDKESLRTPQDLFGNDEFFRRFFGEQPRNLKRKRRQFDQQAPEQMASGSGFIISEDGYILTNHHVVEDAKEVTVRLYDHREFDAEVIGSDQLSDVALIKVNAQGLKAVILGDSDALKPGQWVVAIGSPYRLDFSVTAGIVSAVGRSMPDTNQRYVPFIQTDVAINHGNSGGPLYNMKGEVVGINSQIFSPSGGSIGLSFAIPVEVAKSVSDQLKTKGKVSRGVIGVQIQQVTREHADALGLKEPQGALVGSVQPDSAAEKAGVKVGDVILAFNDFEVHESSELPPIVGSTMPGTRATLKIYRDGKTLSLPIVVDELKGDQQAESDDDIDKSNDALGLVVRNLTEEEREHLELDKKEGVLVEDVTTLAARRSGIRPGDVILMVNQQAVVSADAFEALSKKVKSGQSVMLLIRRGDATSFVAIRTDNDGKDKNEK